MRLFKISSSVLISPVSRMLYTSALLDFIREEGLQIEVMFREVRKKVIKESGGKQTPWESTSLLNDFYFKK